MIFAKAPNAPKLGCSFRRWTDKMCFVFGSSAWTSPGRPRDISAIAILEVSTTALFHHQFLENHWIHWVFTVFSPVLLCFLFLLPLLRFSPFGLCLTTQNNAAENKAQQETRERTWTRGKIAQKKHPRQSCCILLYLAAPWPLWSSMVPIQNRWRRQSCSGTIGFALQLARNWISVEVVLHWSKWVKFEGHSRDFGDMSVNFSDKRRFLWHLQNG